MSFNHRPSYLIVGAGVFGVSTALHLIRKYPESTVTLVDRAFPYQGAASWDWSKVVRADYPNIFYMEKALDAMKIWRTDPLYCQFYHESGLIWVDGKGFARTVVENYKSLGVNERVRIASAAEVRTLYGGVFANAELEDSAEILINEISDWVEASKCLEAVIATAAHEGVKCIEADVFILELDRTGSCIGVRSKRGEVITADKIILATGAQTVKLLADSFPSRPGLHESARLVAAAIFTGMVKLKAEEGEKLKAAPVFLHAAGNSQGRVVVSLSIKFAHID
jgi:sarcosine oxidase / L-pipecolate oxidase